MKASGWLLVLLAAAVGFVLGSLRRQDVDAAVQAESARAQVEIAALFARIDTLTARGPDTILVRDTVRAAARVDTVTAATDVVIMAIPDTVLRAAVDTAVQRERAAWRDRLAAQARLHAALVAIKDSIIDAQRTAITLLTADRDRWRAAKRKDEFFNCTAGGGGVVAAAGTVHAGLGLLCGIELF